MISVIIPYYNASQSICDTVASILDEPWVEIIVVDDASEEPVPDLPAFAKAKLQVIVMQKNVGLAGALACGAQNMHPDSRYLMELDSDDQLLDGALQAMYDALEKNKDLDLVWGDLLTHGNKVSRRSYGPRFDRWIFLHKNALPCCCLMRRSSFEQSGGWNSERGAKQDYNLWLNFCRIDAQGAHIGRPIIRYHIADTGMHRTNRSREKARTASTFARHSDLIAQERDWKQSSRASKLLKLLLPHTKYLPISPYRQSRVDAFLLSLLWARDLRSSVSRFADIFKA